MTALGTIRRNWIPIVFILLALVIVFFDLFTLNQAFLSGDHRDQQYPWAKFYQSQIHQGLLPWWTNQMHCGFPILAEGQIGAFYPLNFLFLFFLPIKAAFNYIVLFQYLLGGIFFYWYLRRHHISRYGSFFATLIFLFGSAQGGYFYYNYISQKVVIWLPLTLILIDRIFEKRLFRDALWLGMVFAIQIFGGYLQVAVYSMLFSGVYFLWSFFSAKQKAAPLFLFVGSVFLGIFFSLIQTLPTLELSLMSSRAGAPSGLAYVGSMLPIGFLTLAYPAWDALVGSEWYVGIVGFFFFMTALLTPKKHSIKPFFVLSLVLFLLLALGKYSPLYRLIIEITHFQGFRTPIKFLFFVTFSTSVLTAIGFDHFFTTLRADKNLRIKILKFFYFFTALALIAPVLGEWSLTQWRPQLVDRFQHYVVKEFHGKAGHPHSLEEYRQKAVGFYDFILEFVSLKNKDTRIEWLLIIGALGAILLALRYRPRSGKILLLFYLFFDLYLYGYTSIRGGLEPFNSIDPPNSPIIVQTIMNNSEPFRSLTLIDQLGDERKLPFTPNSNMLYGVQDIGAYSPLIVKEYGDFFREGVMMNDSLSQSVPEPRAVLDRLDMFGTLNVKYLVSNISLNHPKIKFLVQENQAYLYENLEAKPRVFFVPGASEITALDQIPPTLSSVASIRIPNEQTMEIKINAQGNGLLFISDLYYPGWKAWVNGAEAPIQKTADLFRGIALPQGSHTVLMKYVPERYRHLGLASLILLSLCLTGVSVEFFAKRVSGKAA